MTRPHVSCLLPSVALLLAVAVAPAWAQSAHRAWVSGHGTDAIGCGAPAAPCRSLQYAHDHIVAAGGEIDVLDPAGYGALAITKSISIVNDGVGTAGVQQPNSGQDAIRVNAGPTDAVYLRGLSIDGVGGAGENGVNFVGGARLVVDHCVVRHFSGVGVALQLTSGTSDLEVNDSLLSDNDVGVDAAMSSGSVAQVTGVLNRIIADGNAVAGVIVSSASAAASAKVVVSESDASNNVYGMDAVGGVVLEINNSTMYGNAQFGLVGQSTAKAHIAGSILDGNGQYGINNSVTGTGAIFTAGNNEVEENGLGQLQGVALQTDTLQ